MVMLKHKFKLRFFIDESVSFGTLGDHGKGITEYAGLELNDIDLIMATLEYSAGSIGGFCVGTTYVVEHQGSRCSLVQNEYPDNISFEALIVRTNFDHHC